jgi:hypothetical protein
MITNGNPLLQNGNVICRYVVEARYRGKKPFCIGTFSVRREMTEQETEEAAKREAQSAVEHFYAECLPSDTTKPEITGVRLGSSVFVPDDYEWRRT